MLHQNPKNEAANPVNMFDVGAFLTKQKITPLDIFNQALNKFLLPHEISADRCGIFMQTLIWLATNPEEPLSSSYDLNIEYDSSSTSVTITIRSIDESDFNKIHSFFLQVMPNQSDLSVKYEAYAFTSFPSHLLQLTTREALAYSGVGIINGLSTAHLYALFDVFKQHFTKITPEYLNFCREMSKYHPIILEDQQLKEIITLCSSAEADVAANNQPFLLGIISVLNSQLIAAIETYCDCLINQHAWLQHADDALVLQMNNFFMAQKKYDVLLQNSSISAATEKMMAYLKNKQIQKSMPSADDYRSMTIKQRVAALNTRTNIISLCATPSDSSSGSSLALSKSSESGFFSPASNSSKSPDPASKNDDIDAAISLSQSATVSTPH